MLTKALAVELGPHHITVNAVAPGAINTPGARAATVSLNQPQGVAVDDISSPAFLSRIPLGRTGEPDDVARAALFFVSALADYVTGALLVVDGGYLLK